MQLVQAKEIVFTASEVLNVLPSFPTRIAKELAPLMQKATLETYQHFLLTVYHYTYYAEEQLTHARDLCDDPILYAYFNQMAKEERGHYLLAKKDYEEFGLNVEDSIVPPFVENFRTYWYKLGSRNVNEFIGAMYVFESVAILVAKHAIDIMQRLELTRKQSRWLRVHLEADVGHGEEAFQMCKQYVDLDPAAMLEAAANGADEWMDVFRFAFSNNS